MAVLNLSSSNEWGIRVNGNWEKCLKIERIGETIEGVECKDEDGSIAVHGLPTVWRQPAVEHKITVLGVKLPTPGGPLSSPSTWYFSELEQVPNPIIVHSEDNQPDVPSEIMALGN